MSTLPIFFCHPQSIITTKNIFQLFAQMVSLAPLCQLLSHQPSEDRRIGPQQILPDWLPPTRHSFIWGLLLIRYRRPQGGQGVSWSQDETLDSGTELQHAYYKGSHSLLGNLRCYKEGNGSSFEVICSESTSKSLQ